MCSECRAERFVGSDVYELLFRTVDEVVPGDIFIQSAFEIGDGVKSGCAVEINSQALYTNKGRKAYSFCISSKSLIVPR